MALKQKQIAGMNLVYKHYSFDYFLASMQRLGYRSIELYAAAPHFYPADFTVGEMSVLQRKIAAHGLDIICYTPEQCNYPENIAYSNPTARKRSIESFKNHISICAQLGCRQMLMTSGFGCQDDQLQVTWDRAMDSLSQLAAVAEREGVTIVLEPLREDETELVTNLSLLQKALDQVASPALKGMLDTSPMYYAGETIGEYFQALGPDMRHIHLIDGAPAGHLAWGDGIFPLSTYMAEIDAAAYEGYMTIELTHPSYYRDPELPMAKCLKALEPYLG